MSLDAKKAEHVEKRFKAVFFGEPATYKTYTSINFPAPYLIDTENGAQYEQYVDCLNKKNGAVLRTVDFEKILSNVKSLATEKHPYKTLIIDSATILYDNLLEEAEKKVGNDFGKHYGVANKQMKNLIMWIYRIDMNVILTAHSKNKYGPQMSVIGKTIDCYQKLGHLLDLYIEVQRHGDLRKAHVIKSRIPCFHENQIFDFNYESLTNIYKKEKLEKETVPSKLASPEQIKKLNSLIDLLSISEESVDKWLKKGNASMLSELEYSNANACIEMLNKKLENIQE